jgi:hypothetical protein
MLMALLYPEGHAVTPDPQRVRVSMPIRIASVPSGHPYVRNLGIPDHLRDLAVPQVVVGALDVDVERLPDEPVPGEGPSAARWWPPPMLEPGWAEANSDRFDVFHVHFGFDAARPEDLRGLGRSLKRLGKPLVVTVHDLENPHHDDQSLHRSQLAALLEHATEVLTLTPGAASRIASDYGRSATVVAHPHIVPLERMSDRRGRNRIRGRRNGSEPVTVGLHLKSLRRNMTPMPVLEAAVEEVRDSAGGLKLRVDIHRDA